MQRKECIIDVSGYVNREVMVKLSGGRELTGILVGSDQLINIVLDEAVEHFRSEKGGETTRKIGYCICKGPNILLITPKQGYEEISNPFEQK